MVNLRPISFILGLVLSKIALFMYIPTLGALLSGTDGLLEFAQALIITHIASAFLLAFGRTSHFKLNVKDMFLITSLTWTIASAFAALPFVFINHISFTDAYFETMSGITTTGSTVLSNLDNMAPSILTWRSILQWLGGVGFIVMAVAILPMLNVGGMKLFQTESSEWSDKSVPRTKNLATNIVYVYLTLTVSCFICYVLTGMTAFDALNHALTTVSTGGYSTSDSSMNGFSHKTHWVACVFMLLGGLPFLLLISAVRERSISIVLNDTQVKGFLLVVLLLGSITALWLVLHNGYEPLDAIRLSLFNIISVLTTTGFGLDDFTAWGALTSVIFIFAMMSGACSGSTSGGIKIFRFQIAHILMKSQVFNLIHPSGSSVKIYNQKKLNNDIIRSVVAFCQTFFLTIVLLACALSCLGIDPTTSISGAITAVANVGPGVGSVIGPTGNFATLPDSAKWLLSLGMLMGRLEILTIVVLCFPAFWRT